MCQYSVVKEDGMYNDWHLIHYAGRAVGQTGLIIVEMTNVEPDGRITANCLGLRDETDTRFQTHCRLNSRQRQLSGDSDCTCRQKGNPY